MNARIALHTLLVAGVTSAGILGASEPGGGERAFGLLLFLTCLQAILSALTLAGVVFVIQHLKKPLAPAETPAPVQRVERLTSFDHSMREVSRQLTEIKNELGGLRNSVQLIESQLEEMTHQEREIPVGLNQETLPGSVLRFDRGLTGNGHGGPDEVIALRNSIDKYCSGEIGVEALLETARRAKRKWGSGWGLPQPPGYTPEVAVDWDQSKNTPLLVIEKDDSDQSLPSFWILVNGLRRFSDDLAVTFIEPTLPLSDSVCRTRVPGEGSRIADDHLRVTKAGELAPC